MFRNRLSVYSRINNKVSHPKINIREPIAHWPGHKKATVACRWSPLLYQLKNSNKIASHPYRMICALATIDTVVLYDTQQIKPIAMIGNLHYASLTDIAW